MEELVNVEESNELDEVLENNLFKPLVPDAVSTLRKLMLNSRNEKIMRETAESVLDRAGQTKKANLRERAKVIINDSQINILIQAAKEAFSE